MVDNAGTMGQLFGTMVDDGDDLGQCDDEAVEARDNPLATMAYPHPRSSPHGAIPAHGEALPIHAITHSLHRVNYRAG